MKNTIISKEELEALQEVFKSVDHLVEAHNNSICGLKSAVDKSTKVERLHILTYLDISKDLFKAVQSLKAVIKISEEDFIRAATQEGKRTLDEVIKVTMFKSLMDCLEDEDK